MRFRSVATGQTLIWVILAIAEIAISSARIHKHLARQQTNLIGIDEVTLAAWGVVLILWLSQFFVGRIELEQDGLRLRGILRSTRIPYFQVVGIRPVRNSRGKQILNQIELETARLSADIYPHNYVVIAVSDPQAVLRAIHEKVPAAEYESY